MNDECVQDVHAKARGIQSLLRGLLLSNSGEPESVCDTNGVVP